MVGGNNSNRSLIQKTLLHCIALDNKNIIENTINGFKRLASNGNMGLDQECINVLVEKAINVNCDDITKQNIYSILHSDSTVHKLDDN